MSLSIATGLHLKEILLAATSAVIALVLVEIALRLFTPLPTHSPMANRVPDDRLAYRMTSSFEGIDQNGFRNAVALDTADLVAIGDSHTYGNNVKSEDSWPQQVAAMAGVTVYNFGLGGYGPLQYHYLMERAFQLHPRQIIIAFYLPNDLRDVCDLIRKMTYWQEWATRQGHDIRPCFRAQARPGRSDWSSDRLGGLATHTAVGSLVALALGEVSARIQPNGAVVVEDEMNPTIIKRSRITVYKDNMDLGREEIALGWAVTRTVLAEAKHNADRRGILLGVALLPSRERVFFERLKARQYQLPADYQLLVDNETRLGDEFSRFCQGMGIRAVDVAPHVMRALARKGVYPNSKEGHPDRVGYQAYAEAIYTGILLQAGDAGPSPPTGD